eukprot:874970-Prorocentrum_minimum.AAC.1
MACIGQFTPEELKDLFTYNQKTRCDTHDHLMRKRLLAGGGSGGGGIPEGRWTDATHTVEDAPLAQARALVNLLK